MTSPRTLKVKWLRSALWFSLLLVGGIAHIADARSRLFRSVPQPYASFYKVDRVIPVIIGNSRYRVFQLSTRLDETQAIEDDMRYAVLVTADAGSIAPITYYFHSGFWCFAGKEVRYWTDAEGEQVLAFVQVTWGTGGNAHGSDRDDVLELSSGGVRSLLSMVESAGFHGNIEKLVYLDSEHGYPDILFNDDSLYTTNWRSLPVSAERWNFPTFPRVLRIDGLRVRDVTRETSDHTKRELIRTAEGGGYLGGRYGDPLDSGFNLTTPYNEPRKLADMGDADYLNYAISVLATYYSVGWKEEGIVRFKELVSAREWEYPFQYARSEKYPTMDAVASQCLTAVEELFAEAKG